MQFMRDLDPSRGVTDVEILTREEAARLRRRIRSSAIDKDDREVLRIRDSDDDIPPYCCASLPVV